MKVEQFPGCCSVNVLHTLYDANFVPEKEFEKAFAKKVAKAARGTDWPTSVTLIVVLSKTYNLVRNTFDKHGFKVLMQIEGAHGMEIVILAKNWKES